MPKPLLILICTILALPALAQRSTPASFAQLKTKIDSLTKIADDMNPMERSVFSGRTKDGRYRVEVYCNKPTKEILKANFLVITDSVNYNKIYWFSGNHLIKMNNNNTGVYYQAGDHMYNSEGETVNAASLKKLLDLVTDHYQGLYTALFQ